MNQKIFFIIASLVLFSCHTNREINTKTSPQDLKNANSNVCENLNTKNSKYKTWVNKETGNKLSGYFDGYSNGKPISGFAMSYRDSSVVNLSLFLFDKEKDKINGSIHISVQTSNDTLISAENLKISYEHYLAGSCVTIGYGFEENKPKEGYLKYTVLQKKHRINGCFSAKLRINDFSKETQKKYNPPNVINLENIRFSAIIK